MTIDFDFSDKRGVNKTMQGVFQYDKELKPDNLNHNVGLLVALLEDGAAASVATRIFLQKNGLGLKANNDRPLQHGELSYVIDRLSGRYDMPATRRLINPRSGKPYSASSQQHKAMAKLYEDAFIDASMAVADRYSTLTNTVLIRVYPTKKGIRLRYFTPDLTARVPDPQLADEIDHDHCIALRLAGNLWEVHKLDPETGLRHMYMIKDSSANLDGSTYNPQQDLPEYQIAEYQPFGETEGAYPANYQGILPIVRLDVEPTVGRSWIDVRLSRISYTMGLAGLNADIQSLAAKQAHNLLVFSTDNEAAPMPSVNSHGGGVKISAEDDLRYEIPQSFIPDLAEAAKNIGEAFLTGERIPRPEARGDRAPTGAALKVQEAPLRAYRAKAMPLAVKAEKELWSVIRVLSRAHNLSPQSFGDIEMEVTLGRIDSPEDDGVILDNAAKGIALGVSSPVEAVQRLHNLPEHRAVEHLQKVREHIEKYPALTPTAANQVDQGDNADMVAAANGENSADSVTDLANNRTAAQAREERREDGR